MSAACTFAIALAATIGATFGAIAMSWLASNASAFNHRLDMEAMAERKAEND